MDLYNDLSKEYPDLKDALDEVKGMAGRDQVSHPSPKDLMTLELRIANAGNGVGLCHRQLRVHEPPQDGNWKNSSCLGYLLKKAGVDTEIELHYTCSGVDKPFYGKDSTALEKAATAQKFSGICEMGDKLDYVANHVLKSLDRSWSRPLSVYVLTNAWWTNDRPEDLCGVDLAVKRVVKKLQRVGKPVRWAGFQFIRFFGDEEDVRDCVGKVRLTTLDDGLEDRFREFAPGESDIVDTRDWNDDIRDILKGGVSGETDNKSGPHQSFRSSQEA